MFVVFILSGCGVPGCLDKTATNYLYTIDGNYNPSQKHDCSKVKHGTDFSCCKKKVAISGCIDPTAGNTVENGENYTGQLYDCSGIPGVFIPGISPPTITKGPTSLLRETLSIRSPSSPRPCNTRSRYPGHTLVFLTKVSGVSARWHCQRLSALKLR